MWVALAGQTGAGKSTLAALLNRGLDPTDGAVLVDGYNIREVSLSSLRAQVVVLPSDPVIFAGTPRSNVRFGSPTATDADVRQALWIAAALDFAKDLPGGIDGPIGERGQSLSGGQRQRIALARAVLSQPRLLVLDGGLSQLDPLTEQLVLDRLAASLGNTTVLMIGPRRGGSRRWDHLFELKNGHLVSQDDALSRTGHAALTSSQEPCR
jgi:ATP-binding cassette subfamily B protein